MATGHPSCENPPQCKPCRRQKSKARYRKLFPTPAIRKYFSLHSSNSPYHLSLTTPARHLFPPRSIPFVSAMALSQKLLRHRIVQDYRQRSLPMALSAPDHSSKGPDCSPSSSARHSSSSKSPGIRNKPYC